MLDHQQDNFLFDFYSTLHYYLGPQPRQQQYVMAQLVLHVKVHWRTVKKILLVAMVMQSGPDFRRKFLPKFWAKVTKHMDQGLSTHNSFGEKSETSMWQGTAKWHKEEVFGSDFFGSSFRFRDYLCLELDSESRYNTALA